MITDFEEHLFSESVGILSVMAQISQGVLIIKMPEDRGLESALFCHHHHSSYFQQVCPSSWTLHLRMLKEASNYRKCAKLSLF